MHHKTLAFSLTFSVNHLFEGKPTILKQSDKQLHKLQNKWKIVSAFQATIKKLQRNIIRIKLTSSSSFRNTISKNLGNLSRWIMLSNNTRYWVLTLSLSASSSAFIFIQNIIIMSLYPLMEQYFIANITLHESMKSRHGIKTTTTARNSFLLILFYSNMFVECRYQ